MFVFIKRANIAYGPPYIVYLFHFGHSIELKIKTDLENIKAAHSLMGRLVSVLYHCGVLV